MTCGGKPEEVINNLKEALEGYIQGSLENNLTIPDPAKVSNFKGNIPYRIDAKTHYKLHKLAQEKGKSINKLIDEAVDNLLAG